MRKSPVERQASDQARSSEHGDGIFLPPHSSQRTRFRQRSPSTRPIGAAWRRRRGLRFPLVPQPRLKLGDSTRLRRGQAFDLGQPPFRLPRLLFELNRPLFEFDRLETFGFLWRVLAAIGSPSESGKSVWGDSAGSADGDATSWERVVAVEKGVMANLSGKGRVSRNREHGSTNLS